MGQYYKIAVNAGDGNVRYFIPTFRKLTRHSVFGGDVTERIGQMIHGKHSYVAWIGDYATDEELTAITHGAISKKKHDRAIGCSWPKAKADFKMEEKYLVNHTKKMFIDMLAYRGTMDAIPAEEVYSPLPMLTAIGNGRGGGDYCAEGEAHLPSENLVGTWAWDEISVEDTQPKGYDSFLPLFFLPVNKADRKEVAA